MVVQPRLLPAPPPRMVLQPQVQQQARPQQLRPARVVVQVPVWPALYRPPLGQPLGRVPLSVAHPHLQQQQQRHQVL